MAALVNLDARKLANSIIVHVKIKNKKYLDLGLLFIRLGCFISGAQYKEEEK